MLDRGKRNLLGIGISVIDYDAAVARIISAAKAERPLSVTALAVHGVMTGVQDPAHRHRLNQFDLVVPDGQPVRWALGWLHGEKLASRVYGPELMKRVCAAAAKEGIPVYLYGSRPQVLTALEANLTSEFDGLVVGGRSPSRFKQASEQENAEVIEAINQTRSGIVFVGLGCPRQEVFAYENVDAISRPVIAVGAAYDFHAGLLPQAPKWMADRGLEWLFRLIAEPKRLWRRYLYLNPLYLMRVAHQLLAPKAYDGLAAPAPVQRQNYV